MVTCEKNVRGLDFFYDFVLVAPPDKGIKGGPCSVFAHVF